MFQAHDFQNLIRVLNQLGRAKIETVILESDEVDGEMIDHETRATLQDGVVVIQDISHYRQLDCGHIARASSIVASCDICGRRVCESCFSTCARCNLGVCSYCSRIYRDEDSEKTFCVSCHWDVRTKDKLNRASKAILRLFVKTEED